MTSSKATKQAEAVGSEASETESIHINTNTDAKHRNVHQRLNDARAVLRKRAFSKDLANKQFSSVSIDAMRDAVQEAIIAAGLNLVLVDKEFTVSASGPTKTFVGTAKMRVVNVDDPSDCVEYWTESYANDNGDKGLSKWDTGLLKTAYKEIFQIGERGKDDIDSYSNEELESEAERIEAIRQRREENRRKASEDPFFGKPKDDPLADLRRQIGPLMTDHADVVRRYKSEHGPVPSWSEETLRACIAEAKGGEQ